MDYGNSFKYNIFIICIENGKIAKIGEECEVLVFRQS